MEMISQKLPPWTSRRAAGYLDIWPWLALLSSGAMLLALCAAPFQGRKLLSTQVTVPPQGTVPATSPFTLRPDNLGSLRVDVRAVLPAGRWLTYEIQLRDAQDNVLAAAVKSAWHERGTWREDGESGTWQESDVRGALDIQAQQPEEMTVAIAVLNYTDTAGQPISEPVGFSLRLHQRVVNANYLWPGLVGTTGLSLLAFLASGFSGQRVMDKVVKDSDPRDRAILGGPHNLVRATVTTQADETSPKRLQIKLSIRDGNGSLVYAKQHAVTAEVHRDSEGSIDHYSASLELFFEFETLDSYGMAVDVSPDGPIDKTTLTVEQNVRTLLPVTAIQIPALG